MGTGQTDSAGSTRAATRAAEYVRMSTEHQQYSTQNQTARIREYAEQRGIEVVQTYADEGKSGLRIAGRFALQQLIKDVESGNADFSMVLVYDVSRWGRFQDADESAYYEYICKRAGIQVAYCAEQFENDGSPVSTIVKGVKRAMAGEYSRELSAKVFAGQCRLIEEGYRQGGPAGFGLRRLLVDQHGEPKVQLARGEHKSLQTDRVVLVPGPDSEVLMVRQIYRWFVSDGLPESIIAERLNASGVLTDQGRAWTRATVHEVLINEKYIGSNVYNRISFKLRKLRVVNPSEMWIRNEDAFAAIVAKEDFYTAQGIIRARSRRFTDEQLIDRLRHLYQERQALSGLLINSTEGMPSSSVYASRFGSLIRAYQLVGYTPSRDFQYIEINRLLRRLHPTVVAETEAKMEALGGKVRQEPDTDLLRVNEEFTVSLVLARCHHREAGQLFWKVRLDAGLCPDLTVAVRLAPENRAALDYYLLPRLDFAVPRIRLGERNPVELENFRFDSLDYLYGMAARTRLRRAA
ncbi:recombinase family protein [Variovorax sp. Sphag1AA]|uniref:recombinase family protein n=1 Tax=Variovorax sp. Sphag1AA TaxID=2587027 RepID=UPI00161F7900|nr:recombinase family protein [Variovorax sp. Sphag1AA]MBB3176351.1 DNA invertase Pin-like site-specific DNA recombinase [Variovorax sp. Sphag1AA]